MQSMGKSFKKGISLKAVSCAAIGIAFALQTTTAFADFSFDLSTSILDGNLGWFEAFQSLQTGQTPETPTQILTAESDAIPGSSRLAISRDASGAMASLVYYASEGGTINYTLSQLRQKPQVLKRLDGHDVILVSLEKDFSPIKGGHVIMRYLVNGITGKYLNFRIWLDVQGASIVLRGDPNPKDPESDENSYTSVFNYIFLAKNTVFGKIVGIEKVQPSQK